MKTKIPLAFSIFLLLGFMNTGCREGSGDGAQDLERYRHYLETTHSDHIGVPSEEKSREAVQRFVDFYRVYSEEVIRKHLRSLYGKDIYFRDPFHEVEGIEAAEDYFLRAAEPVADCRFEIEDISSNGGEYYFRWVMHLRLKRDNGREPTETPGMSHVRFNREGKVVFHVDYWDPSIPVYGRIPVIRSLIGIVKKKI